MRELKKIVVAGALWSLYCSGLAQKSVNPTFDVASVRKFVTLTPGERPGIRGGPGTSDPGRIRAVRVSLRDLIMRGWGVEAYQVTGPDWISPPSGASENETYDVIAIVPPGASKDQVTVMWQGLLEDRFDLVLHHLSKEFAAKDLIVAKGGARITPSTLDPKEPTLDTSNLTKDQIGVDKNGCADLKTPAILVYTTNGPGGAGQCMAIKGQSISHFTHQLSQRYGQPVIDKTGLIGIYDFTIRYGRGNELADAMERALGLKLTPSKATVDVLVIDKVNKMPTDN